MPQLTIKLEKEDIITSQLGVNVIVQCKDNINLIFTPEALDELITDVKDLKLPPIPPIKTQEDNNKALDIAIVVLSVLWMIFDTLYLIYKIPTLFVIAIIASGLVCQISPLKILLKKK
jgi:hypothetical protein